MIILSVIGNFIVIFNVTWVSIFFEDVRYQQGICYFLKGQYTPANVDAGHACFKKWIDEHGLYRQWCRANAICLCNFASILAVIPYVVRSIRIKKMFEFRETYVQTGKIPRHDIRKWDESRLTKNIIILSSIYTIAVIDVHY